MKEAIKEALFEMFALEEEAARTQEERGRSDKGNRSGVTSGKHLDPLASAIANELLTYGVSERELFVGNSPKEMTLPGYYRPTKKWDILAFRGGNLMTAIELKSISSSYGNNFNNRAEEAVGSGEDAKQTIRNNLLGGGCLPTFCYALVVRYDDSLRRLENYYEPYFKVDPEFKNADYVKKTTTMCLRLLSEKLYDAVWLVFVNLKNHEIYEPSEAISYDKFIKRIKGQIDLFD